MVENLMRGMKEVPDPAKSEEGPVTLLVTGGFHAEA